MKQSPSNLQRMQQVQCMMMVMSGLSGHKAVVVGGIVLRIPTHCGRNGSKDQLKESGLVIVHIDALFILCHLLLFGCIISGATKFVQVGLVDVSSDVYSIET